MPAAFHHIRAAAREVVGQRPGAPLPEGRLARVTHGLLDAVQVARSVARDRELRRLYLRNAIQQLAAIAVLLLVFLPSAFHGVRWARAHGAEVNLGGRAVVALSLAYGVLCPIEWLVVALWREPTDALIHAVSTRVGVVPEDCPERPRVRLDLRWIVGRVKRQAKALLIFSGVLPLVALVQLLPVVGRPLDKVLIAAWTTYWALVLTTARTRLAWTLREAREPWFERGAEQLTAVGLLGWWAPRWYTRFLRYIARGLRAPAAAFERAPWQLGGVLVARSVASVPVISIFLRPLIGISVARLLVEAGVEPAPLALPAAAGRQD